jgi:hypothetical protein
MRDNLGLNERQAKFAKLAAPGDISIVEAYRRAGFANDAANANKLYKRLVAGGFISAERDRLGLPPIGEEEASPEFSTETKALVEEQRRLYRIALDAGNVGAAQKCLRAIERMTRARRPAGRPASSPQAKTPASSERDSIRADALVSAFLLPEDEEEIRERWEGAPSWGRIGKAGFDVQDG